jgi:hypothetical protein
VRAQTLPPAAGWQWILGGFAIFRRNPVMLGMLVVAYWFTVLFLNVVPVIGVLLASLAIPGLSVGLMQAARNVERGQPVGIQTLYGSLRDNARTLIALGALYLCCTLGALACRRWSMAAPCSSSCCRTVAPSEPWSRMQTSRCRHCSSCCSWRRC